MPLLGVGPVFGRAIGDRVAKGGKGIGLRKAKDGWSGRASRIAFADPLATPAGIEPATFSLEGYQEAEQAQGELILFEQQKPALWDQS
jgi:hypothetical protein